MLRAVLCLVLGALTTVGVAWGAALRGVPRGSTQGVESSAIWIDPDLNLAITLEGQEASSLADACTLTLLTLDRELADARPSHGTLVRHSSHSFSGSRESIVIPRVPGSWHPPQDVDCERHEFQFGWPNRALWAAQDWNASACMRSHRADVWVLQVRESRRFPEPFAYGNAWDAGELSVPLGVIPTGFAVDTAFHASAWILLFSILSFARGRLRIRNNHCLRCGYRRAGIPIQAPCPECGTAAHGC